MNSSNEDVLKESRERIEKVYQEAKSTKLKAKAFDQRYQLQQLQRFQKRDLQMYNTLVEEEQEGIELKLDSKKMYNKLIDNNIKTWVKNDTREHAGRLSGDITGMGGAY